MGILNEELRPKTFDQVFLLKEDRQKIEAWADSWSSGTPEKRGLILSGPPGMGKTSIAYALSRSKGWDIIEINGSEGRTEDFIKRTIGMFSLYGDLTWDDVEKKKKAGLIDEADNIYERSTKGGTGESGGYRAIADILKNTNIPIIITMNDFANFKYRKGSNAAAIINLCVTVEIKKIFSRKGGSEYRNIVTTLASEIQEFSSKLGLKPQKNIIEKIIEGNLPDIRASINDAEAYVFSQSENLIGSGNRDEQSIIWDTLSGIFHRDDYLNNVNLIDSSDSDSGQILLWISQNIFSQSKTLESALESFEYVSVIDQIERFAYRHNYYRMLLYAKDLEALFATRFKGKTGVFIPFKFSNYLSQMSKTKKSRGTRNKVARDLSAILHISKEQAYEMRGVLRVMAKLRKSFPDELVRYINAEIGKHNSMFVTGNEYKEMDALDLNDLEMFID
ncbi:MAG: AAA family ATPase [Candidatus Thermoplasmatota archaeon]|nr:AAA family ATPase [Candidatus Thermoplasmatota archaeon]MCL5889327.1 AAA family ATPase [Candidatus Thermoplasmatota archaeon]